MQMSKYLFELSRPLVFLVIMANYMIYAGLNDLPTLAVYAVSAGFFIASSSVQVGWVQSSRRVRYAAVLLEAAWVTALAAYASLHGTGGPMQVLFIVMSVTVPLVLDRPWWWPSVGVLVVLFLLTGLPDWVGQYWADVLLVVTINCIGLVVAGMVGMLMRTLTIEKERADRLIKELAESRTALERANRQLHESAAQQQAMAVLEERQRLAREIHDSVAHGLTALIVQIQAGRRLLDRMPDHAAATFERCEALAREALLETRVAVRALHNIGLGDETDVAALERLGRDFSMVTGIAVEVTADEPARHLPPNAARLEQLYRIFQEALTNAHRHGGARRVQAAFAVDCGSLLLTISNDGLLPARLDPGMGLQSMAERAHALGGTVRFEPGETTGLTIHVAVPFIAPVNEEAVG